MTNLSSPSEIENLQNTIAALEAQRVLLGDSVADMAIAPLQQRLASLQNTLVGAEPVTEQRKQVTVMFADVTGFTALSEKMDPEDLTNLVNCVWLELDNIILAYGGQIDKHMGDGVMALWGEGQSREDDCERAIRAALVMEQTLRGLAQPSPSQPPLTMRIGIHTGLVLLGQVGTVGEFSAIGDTVNTASRIEQAAPSGGILISHSAYRMVRGAFDLRALEPLTVKGKKEPVQVYLVERARPRAFRVGARGVEGVETRMIGRQTELEQIRQACGISREEDSGQMITILGEAGLGKSRLLHEFLCWLGEEPGVDLFKARADEEMQRTPYATLREMMAQRWGILESDSAASARAKLEQGLAETGLQSTDEVSDQARLVGQLLGYETSDHAPSLADARDLRNRALQILSSYFASLGAGRLLVFLLDDLHWSDDSSLDAILHLAQSLAAQPVLWVCAARPTLYERRSMWGETLPFHTRLELRPLSTHESLTLVQEILQKAQNVPESLRALIVQNAEGNPFYVEELIKMLLDDGVIVKETPVNGQEESVWRVELSRLGELRIPSTLNGVLQARFDSLPADERLLLQQASVVGRIFWEDTVNFLLHSEGDPVARRATVQQGLGMLRRREMIFANGTSAFEGTREYLFKHALLRDAVYGSILKRVRRNYHALVADWLLHNTSNRVGEVYGLVADHLEQAGRIPEAVEYLRKAGQQAATQFANIEAINYFTRALSLSLADAIRDRFDLLLARESLFDLMGERENQQKDLEQLQELAAKLNQPVALAEVALRRARHAQQTSEYARAVSYAEKAIPLAQQTGKIPLEAASRLELGRALYRQANYPAARRELEKAMALVEPETNLAADILQTLFVAAMYQGDYAGSQRYLEQARAALRKTGNRQVEANLLYSIGLVALENDPHVDHYFSQALALYREIGDRRGEAQALQQMGFVYDRTGSYPQAREHYILARNLYHAIGDRLGEGWMLNAIGSVYQYEGCLSQALPYFQQALALYHTIRVPWGEAISLHNLGALALTGGRYEAACESLNAALEICSKSGDVWGEIWRMSYLGLLEFKRGNFEHALDWTTRAYKKARQVDAHREIGMTLTHRAHALLGLGRLPEASRDYERAVQYRRGVGENHLAIESLAGLAQVRFSLSDLGWARELVDEILETLSDSPSLPGTDEPLRVYLTCWQVLNAVEDPRAPQLLANAKALLEERLQNLAEPDRHAFRQIDLHQMILTL